MQLWKKNFFFVVLLFQVILFSSLWLTVTISFKQALTRELYYFNELRQESHSLLDNLIVENGVTPMTEFIESMHEQQAFYFDLSLADDVLFSTVPTKFNVPASRINNSLEIHKDDGLTYLTYSRLMTVNDQTYQVNFIKDASSLYQQQKQLISLVLLGGLLFSILISGLIYWQLKKIYKPIQHLSHELRTPLTLISGYSELLARVKTTEEEKIDISQHIYAEATQLQATIEQLLIMGDLNEETVTKTSLSLVDLLQELIVKYPTTATTEKESDFINGNHTLLIRLFDNLLANAFNASQEVYVLISGKEVTITNRGTSIAPKTIKKLNTGKKLLPAEYTGTGQGFIICRDIVKLHDGKIKISSNAFETIVTVTFTK